MQTRNPLGTDLQGDLGTFNEHAPAQAVLGAQRLIDLAKGVHLQAGPLYNLRNISLRLQPHET